MMLSMGVQKGVAIWKRIVTLSHSMRSLFPITYYKNLNQFQQSVLILVCFDFVFYMRIRRGEALEKLSFPDGKLLRLKVAI
jgi:hypothetical protein